MKVDLHCHSVYSDGSLTPAELILRAKEQGVSAVALSDHDTVKGVAEALEAGKKYGVEVIPACEMSVKHSRLMHILAFYIDHTDKRVTDRLEGFLHERETRNQRLAAHLKSLGYDIELSEVEAVAGSDNISRAHFGKVLADKGYFKDIPTAFSDFLSKGKPGYVERNEPMPEETIEFIHSVGGLAVLAHPHQSINDEEELEPLIARLSAAGLDGMECIYTDYTAERTEKYCRLAQKYGLFISGGSDFHGVTKPHIELGRGTAEHPFSVPYEIFENIKEIHNEK